MSPMETYVHAWSESLRSVQNVCAELGPEDWIRPTDCPRWTVHDVVAHLAAIESDLVEAESAAPTAPAPSARGATVVTADYTQTGVDARRDRTPGELLAELDNAFAARTQQLRTLPEDPGTPAPHTPAGVRWDWGTLLRNRAIDLWVHEQDIRRAVGAPGGFDETGARIAADTFAGAMGYVLGKQVAPPAGTTVAWEVTGALPFELRLGVGANGRAEQIDDPALEPDTTLSMDIETFTVLAAGRHPRRHVDVGLSGDPRLGGHVLSAMAVTS